MGRPRASLETSLPHLIERLTSVFAWTTDGELRITSVSGGGLAMLGIGSPEEIVGQRLDEFLAARSDSTPLEAHRTALAGDPTCFTEEWRRWVFDVQVEPLRDAHGDIVGTAGLALDVTKRRLAEAALTESEARFRTLVERLPIVTYVNKLGSTIETTYMSPQVEQLLGYPAEDWLEPDFFLRVLHPDDCGRVMREVHRTHATGESFRSEYRLVSRDGDTVWVRDETVAVEDEHGRPLFLQGFLLEIGDREQLAREGRRVPDLAYGPVGSTT